MSFIKNICLVSLGVAVGIGLYSGVSCKSFNKGPEIIVIEPDLQKCSIVYKEELDKLENKYQELIPNEKLATPNDISIDYIISNNAEFKGLIFTDKETGFNGVITKNNLFGNNSYKMEYVNLEGYLDHPYEGMTLFPDVKIYQHNLETSLEDKAEDRQ